MPTFKKFRLLWFLLILISFSVSVEKLSAQESDRLQIITEYADRILEVGIDQWSGEETPLLTDGINVHTGEPVKWKYSGEEYIISNMASQQNLFRLLTGLTNLTGDEKYKQAAKESIQYHFDHLLSPSGLVQWGGHQFIDLSTLQPANHSNGFDSFSHEFKNHFPFYDLMREVDAVKTAEFIRALWNAHVRNWNVLDMSRHGSWDKPMSALWNHQFTDPDPFFEDRGLTFVNAGSDLIYAANRLYDYENELGAFDWANHMHSMYVKARHPETGLGVYQYSKPERRATPPAEGSLEDYTNSRYGDRAENQFSNVYGDVAREGWVLWGGRVKSIYVKSGYVMLGLAEEVGEDGAHLINDTVDGLLALTEHAYVAEENHFKPMWADGTDLTGQTYPRTGYYGSIGTEWRPVSADMEFLKTYIRAYRLSGNETLWETARNIASGLGLGEIGSEPGVGVSLNMGSSDSGYHEIYTLLELHQTAPHPEYLERAEIVANRTINNQYHHGYFLPSSNHIHAKFDSIEPLALLALEATLLGSPELVPDWNGGEGYIHGNFEGLGRTYDSDAIWSITMDEVEVPTVTLIEPSQGQVVSVTPNFTWEQVSFAEQYQIQLTATNFSTPENILLDSTLTDLQLNYPAELDHNESYRWRVRAINDNGDPGNWSDNTLFYTEMATSVEGISGLPKEFMLRQNYPNPFNPETSIQFELPHTSTVDLKVYDMVGREVARLVSEQRNAGYHTIRFDASSLASGIYIYQLRAVPSGISGGTPFTQTRKMTLIK